MFHKRPNVTLRPRQTRPDSAGLLPRLYVTNMHPYNKTHSSLGKAICTPMDDIPLRQLCTHNASELLIESTHRNTSNSARSHYDINTVIHINLITMNNASLSHNSTYRGFGAERRQAHFLVKWSYMYVHKQMHTYII